MITHFFVFFKFIKSSESNIIVEIRQTQFNILIEIEDLISKTNIPSSILGHKNSTHELINEISKFLSETSMSKLKKSYLLFIKRFKNEGWYINDIEQIKNELIIFQKCFSKLYLQIRCYKELIYNFNVHIKQAIKLCNDIIELNPTADPNNLCSLIDISEYLNGEENRSEEFIEIIFKSLNAKEIFFQKIKVICFNVIGFYKSWTMFIFTYRPLKIRKIIMNEKKCNICYAPSSLFAQNFLEILDLILHIAKKFISRSIFINKNNILVQENIFWIQIFVIFIKDNFFNYIEDFEKLEFAISPSNLNILVENMLKEWANEFYPVDLNISSNFVLNKYKEYISKQIKHPKKYKLAIKAQAIKIQMILDSYFTLFEKMSKNILKLSDEYEDFTETTKNLEDIHKEIYKTDIDLQTKNITYILSIVESDFYSLKNAILILLKVIDFYLIPLKEEITKQSCLDVLLDENTRNIYIIFKDEIQSLIIMIENKYNHVIGAVISDSESIFICSVYDPISSVYLDFLEKILEIL